MFKSILFLQNLQVCTNVISYSPFTKVIPKTQKRVHCARKLQWHNNYSLMPWRINTCRGVFNCCSIYAISIKTKAISSYGKTNKIILFDTRCTVYCVTKTMEHYFELTEYKNKGSVTMFYYTLVAQLWFHLLRTEVALWWGLD